jgi:hypothetical protein
VELLAGVTADPARIAGEMVIVAALTCASRMSAARMT